MKIIISIDVDAQNSNYSNEDALKDSLLDIVQNSLSNASESVIS